MAASNAGVVGMNIRTIRCVGGKTPFDQVALRYRCRVFDVDYVRFEYRDGGELFLTRYGWHLLPHLLPTYWFTERRYLTHGQRLAGGTGSVYRVPTVLPGGRRKDLVVKFSRFAEDVPLWINADVAPMVPRAVRDAARFNSPFEEFGLVMALRRNPNPPGMGPFRTKRPLAIYVPPQRHPTWQLGRHEDMFARQQIAIDLDQARHRDRQGFAIRLDARKQYVEVFEWVRGDNAEDLNAAGALTTREMEALTHRAADELLARGFMVLDHKPRHLILRRRRRDGQVVRRGGELIFALVDFELLVRRSDAAVHKAGA